MQGLMPWNAGARNGHSRRQSVTGTRYTQAAMVWELPETAMARCIVPSPSRLWAETLSMPTL